MRKFGLYAAIVLFVSLLLYFAICSYTYSNGARSGVLIKFSKKGFLFKTYEGDINTGYINTNNMGLTANLFHFSVEKSEKEAIEMLNNMEGREVKLHYKQKIKAMPWQGETSYLIYKVEALKPISGDNR